MAKSVRARQAQKSDDAMIQDIQRIDYRSGLLPKGMKCSCLPIQTWKGPKIPLEFRKAMICQNILNCGGIYGDRAAAEPAEYDHLRIVLTNDTVDIEVFNRRLLLASGDDRFQQVHRVLCKLNKAYMTVPEVFTPEQQVGADPRLLVPPGGTFTYRDQANVMTLLAFRNGPIENLHAGQYSALLENADLSRITDEEMKTIMIDASTKLAELLALRDSDPEAFAQTLAVNWRQVKKWER